MKSIFKKITTLGLFSFLLFGIGLVTNASGGGGGGSSSSSTAKISAPVFNTGWVINGETKRVCWGLPEHATWNTGSVNGILINSIYGDLMEITVPLVPSALLGVLTHRADPTRCPIICDDGYSYNSTTKTCDKTSTQPTQPTGNSGYIALSNDANMDKVVFAAPYASNIVIASGTLTVSEPVKLSNIKLALTTVHGSGVASIIEHVKIKINGDIYNASESCTLNGCSYVTDADEIIVNNTTNITVLVDIKANAPESAIVKFSNLTYESFGGQISIISNNEIINKYNIPGSIVTANIVIKHAKLNITNNESSTQKVVIGNSNTVTIFDGEIVASNSNVSVNKLIIEESNSSTLNVTNADRITLTIYINGQVYSDELINSTNNKATFVDLGDILDGKSMEIRITAQPDIFNATGYIDFKVSAAGTDSRGNDIESNKISAARLQIIDHPTATIASSSTASTVILDGANTELVTFTATIKDGSYDLNKVTIELDSGVDILANQSFTLEIDGSAVDSSIYDGSTGIIINYLNETLEIGKHTLVVKANANVGNFGSAIIDIKSIQLNSDTPKTMSVRRLITKAYPIISALKNNSDLILRISSPKDHEENFEIYGFEIIGKIASAAFNEHTINNLTGLNTEVAEQHVTLVPGEMVELILQAAKNETVQVTAIYIKIDDKIIRIDYDYTNIGKWASFKVTAEDHGPSQGFTVDPVVLNNN